MGGDWQGDPKSAVGFSIEERKVDIETIMADILSGTITEAFGSGTAAVITPVGALCYKEQNLNIGSGGVGTLTQKLYDTLTGIQTGHLPDRFGWVRKL